MTETVSWRRTLPGAVAGLALLALAFGLSLTLGARAVAWSDMLAVLQGPPETLAEAAVAARLPRSLLAMLAGAALGLAGAAMQGVTRNPLADPGLLGTNAGAALAVVIAMATVGIGSAALSVWVAVLGAGLASAGVYAIANLGRGGASPLKLALAGAALTAAMSSSTTAILLPRGDIGGLAQSWMIGGVGGARLETILPVLPFLGAGALAVLGAARKLNLLAMGEDMARGLGERVGLARALAAGGAVLLAGAVTALCGPIGFVGLIVPHGCRVVMGGDYRRILPASALGGAVLLLLADVAGRLIATPGEVDAGIITALIGGPVFIWIVRHGKAVAV